MPVRVIAPFDGYESGRRTCARRRFVSRLKTGASAWFAIGVVLLVLAAVVLNGTARDVVESVGVFALIGACIRAVVLAVRDDEVSSATVRDPAGRTLGMMGADSRHARRRRQRAAETARKLRPPGS
jgi:hypothetical protein